MTYRLNAKRGAQGWLQALLGSFISTVLIVFFFELMPVGLLMLFTVEFWQIFLAMTALIWIGKFLSKVSVRKSSGM